VVLVILKQDARCTDVPRGRDDWRMPHRRKFLDAIFDRFGSAKRSSDALWSGTSQGSARSGSTAGANIGTNDVRSG
jgi:hypothetical protein